MATMQNTCKQLYNGYNDCEFVVVKEVFYRNSRDDFTLQEWQNDENNACHI